MVNGLKRKDLLQYPLASYYFPMEAEMDVARDEEEEEVPSQHERF